MSIFRAYDIRGVFGKDLTLDIAEDIGKAFGTYVSGKEIVLGYDCRLSSGMLRDAVIKGLTYAGCDVVDIGMVPTPVFYFKIHHHNKAGGIMITGSHNPSEYNGFKLCKGPHALYGEEIQELKEMIEKRKFRKGKNGDVKTENIAMEYIKFVEDRIKILRPMKVVIDAGNGTAGKISSKIFRDLRGCRAKLRTRWQFPKTFSRSDNRQES